MLGWPPGRLRVVGDVHGDARGFAAALATDRFVLQLGDLVDGGDSAAVLRLMLAAMDKGRGAFLLGNHEARLWRVLTGRTEAGVQAETVSQLDADLRTRVVYVVPLAPGWLRRGDEVFVHGGFHTAMLSEAPQTLPADGRARGVLARALFGEPTGRTQTDGYPERSLRWVERIPAGVTVYCGHDWRSTDGRPWVRENERGGRAVFLDTGAGKGGHVSWIDLDPQLE